MEALLDHLPFVSKLWPNHKRQISWSPYLGEKVAFSHPNNRDRPKPYQAQDSPLLTKLPPEIRYLIWQYVLGGKVIRLRLEPGKILHFQDYFESGIPISKINSSHLSQSHLNIYYGYRLLEGVDLANNRYEIPAALLRVCRLIHLEASHILYRQNIFFMESDVFLHIFRGHQVSHKSFTGIRHLRLFLDCPAILRPRAAHELPSTWERLWAAVAELQLASLGAHIAYSYDHTFYPDMLARGIEAPAVLPLLDIRGIDVVQLVIGGSSKGSMRRFELEEEIKKWWRRPAAITPGER